MASHSVLNVAAFRGAFPAFANSTTFPDVMINAYYANAGNFISQNDSYSGGLSGASLDFALQLLTAHLLQSSAMIAAGQVNVVVTGSTVASVSVSLLPPPVKTAWQFWLATTAYGQQLRALLSTQSAGGWAIGGRGETAAFRKVGGAFW